MAQVGQAATHYAGVEACLNTLFLSLMEGTGEAVVISQTLSTENLVKICKKLAAMDKHSSYRPMPTFALNTVSAAGQRRAVLVHSVWGLADFNSAGPRAGAIGSSVRGGRTS